MRAEKEKCKTEIIGDAMMLPLGFLARGEQAQIIEIKENKGFCTAECCGGRHRGEGYRLENMGIRTGKYVEMLNNERLGPLLIKVDESRIAISRGMAMRIWVRRER